MPFKYIYTNDIAKRISEIIAQVPEIITSQQGDLSHLPTPEDIPNFVPAALIAPLDIENEFADGIEKGTILHSTYGHIIYIVIQYQPYENPSDKVLKLSEIICEKLLRHRKLGLTEDPRDQFIIPGGGVVLASIPKRVNFESYVYDFFKQLNLNLAVSEIEFNVYFRTFK